MSEPPTWEPKILIGEWVRNNVDYLYKSNRVVLRENLQNAVDAIRMSKRLKRPAPKVDITYDPARRQLVIHDNGIGMTLHEQHESFWKPYGSSKRSLPPHERMENGLIGQFGIGAYASLRVAQSVTVVSKSEKEPASPPCGTSVALKKPLLSYREYEVPEISFRDLSSREAASLWRAGAAPGTSVILSLVDALDLSEAKVWVTEASTFLREKVAFQGKVVNAKPRALPTLSRSTSRDVTVTLSKYDNPGGISQVNTRVSLDESSTPQVELCSVLMVGNQKEQRCGGVLSLSPKEDPRGAIILKHQFQFVSLGNTHAWIETNQTRSQWEWTLRSMPFDGEVDIPFATPDPSREGFSQIGTDQLCAILTAMSRALVEEAARKGGNTLKEHDQFFEFIWPEDIDERLRLLGKYPLKMVGHAQSQTLNELIEHKSKNDALRVLYITDKTTAESKKIAETLALIENYSIVEIEGPQYWRGYCIEKVIQERTAGSNIADSSYFVSILPDEELGPWRAYRSQFLLALTHVIGPGRKLEFARIEPEDVALVVREGSPIVHLNYNNPKVQELPASELVGPDLEKIIRNWAFGEVAAEKIEEQLLKQGKLVVVQKITDLVPVQGPEMETYVPAPDDEFLLFSDNDTSTYYLKVSAVCQPSLVNLVDTSGNLEKGYAARLAWVGNTFYFTFRHNTPSRPTVLFEFRTSVVLRNPERDHLLDGSMDYEFRIRSFPGSDFGGPIAYFELPFWIGELLNTQRSRTGAVTISISTNSYFRTLDGSEDPKWWTRLWARARWGSLDSST